MDPLDKALLRAWDLFSKGESADAEIDGLLPTLIKAGYVEQRPWGDDESGAYLWNFTDPGVERAAELGSNSN
jgi:hypothetical protein